jgi:hypothetical protein
VEVVQEPFEDAGEQTTNGYDDYYYSGVVYRFLFAERELRARRCDDTPGEAHFLCFVASPDGARCLFEAIPYDDAQFQEAAVYLRDRVGADKVRILLPGGYSPVDFRRFPSSSANAQTGESLHCFQCRAAIPEDRDRCPKCGWSWQAPASGDM